MYVYVPKKKAKAKSKRRETEPGQLKGTGEQGQDEEKRNYIR